MFLPVIKPLLRTALLIVSIIVYALTILSAYGGRFDPDFFTFPSLLTLALPWLAIATLLPGSQAGICSPGDSVFSP